MKQILFDTGKNIIEFRIDNLNVTIIDESTATEWICNAKTFSDTQKTKKSEIILRRSKGEKWLSEWKKDLAKFNQFSTEDEIIDDIINDFHKERGWKIIKNGEMDNEFI